MPTPVNLANFRRMTGGDQQLEKELFQEFLSSFEKGLKFMQENIAPGVSHVWYAHAHSLRGISANLGAKALDGLCKQAQDNAQMSAEVKNEILETIGAQYAQVRQFLLNIP